MNGIIEKIILQDEKFWFDLSFSLGIGEIRVLELIYGEEPYSLDELVEKLRLRYQLDYCKNKVRKIILKFGEKGLIKIINSKPLFVNPIIFLEDNIKKLVFISKERFKLK